MYIPYDCVYLGLYQGDSRITQIFTYHKQNQDIDSLEYADFKNIYPPCKEFIYVLK